VDENLKNRPALRICENFFDDLIGPSFEGYNNFLDRSSFVFRVSFFLGKIFILFDSSSMMNEIFILGKFARNMRDACICFVYACYDKKGTFVLSRNIFSHANTGVKSLYQENRAFFSNVPFTRNGTLPHFGSSPPFIS
jgi:hypothetical protein